MRVANAHPLPPPASGRGARLGRVSGLVAAGWASGQLEFRRRPALPAPQRHSAEAAAHMRAGRGINLVEQAEEGPVPAITLDRVLARCAADREVIAAPQLDDVA